MYHQCRNPGILGCHERYELEFYFGIDCFLVYRSTKPTLYRKSSNVYHAMAKTRTLTPDVYRVSRNR